MKSFAIFLILVVVITSNGRFRKVLLADTWVDEVAVVKFDREAPESNVRPPNEFFNHDNTARLVDDLVSGEQVLVVGDGWHEPGRGPVYRIIRRVVVRVGGLSKRGYYWSAETRAVNELAPIPSV